MVLCTIWGRAHAQVPACVIDEHLDMQLAAYENRVRRADLIVTAKVLGFDAGGADVALLLVKRVYKAHAQLQQVRAGQRLRVAGFLVPFDREPEDKKHRKSGGGGVTAKGENVARRHVLEPLQRAQVQRRQRRWGLKNAARGCALARTGDTKLFVVGADKRGVDALFLVARPYAVTLAALQKTKKVVQTSQLKGRTHNFIYTFSEFLENTSCFLQNPAGVTCVYLFIAAINNQDKKCQVLEKKLSTLYFFKK
jgi:hypothetical protein